MKDDFQFIDIGVFKGSKIDCITNINPYARIIGVEAFKDYYDNLKIKYKKNQNIKLFNYAISDQNNISRFYFNNQKIDKEAFSLKKNNKFNKIQKTKCRTLIKILKNKSASIIKIDTEGSEYDILKSSKKILSNNKPALFIETTDKTFKDIINFLQKYNYFAYVYEKNIFKKKLKNNWKKGNVISNNEFDNKLYETSQFYNIKKSFMFNIIAIPEEKKKYLKNFKIIY
jgi:FkbM family methyltransferase